MDFGTVIRRLAGSPPECREGAPSLDPDMETSTERGGRPASVRNVLSVNNACRVTFWDRDMDFVGGNGQESGGGAHGSPHTRDGSDGQSTEGRYLENRGISEVTQGSKNAYTGGVHWQS